MTLCTTVHIATPVDPLQVFKLCRQLIGIPENHPYDEQTPGLVWSNGVWVNSHPGGFRSALDVSHNHGELLAREPGEDDEGGDTLPPDPPAYVAVKLDTTYSYRGHNDQGCDDVHREITAALGKWLDEQGADWWAMDEYWGDWHHRTPCPLPETIRRNVEIKEMTELLSSFDWVSIDYERLRQVTEIVRDR